MPITTVSVGSRSVSVDASWDDEASVWIAIGQNIRGLVVEAGIWPTLIQEIQLAVPELLDAMAAMNPRSPDGD
ncbi:MAG TPA: DUF1902 domain-containing protein [Xanthobacteraceae bacterium]|nr:DUF1902 domain-containing protein [Xanthobacteraceae bacterium]